jgi:hypothetical protein
VFANEAHPERNLFARNRKHGNFTHGTLRNLLSHGVVTQTFVSANEKKHEGPNRITKKESVIEKFQWEQTQAGKPSSRAAPILSLLSIRELLLHNLIKWNPIESKSQQEIEWRGYGG